MTKRKRISRIVNGILLGICILSAVAALLLGGETVKEGWEYDSLAKAAEGQTADGIDWSMLRSRNQDIAALKIPEETRPPMHCLMPSSVWKRGRSATTSLKTCAL